LVVRETWMIQPGSLPLWVHPVFKRDVRELSGCADVIYEYASEHEIKPYGGTEIFKNVVKIIHDHGMKIFVSLGTGDRFSVINPCTWHLVHPETWIEWPPDAIDPTPWIKRSCVNNPVFIEYTKQYYSNLFKNYDIDGVGFDEPHEFPCICKYCQKRFEELNHRKMSGRGDEENLRFQAESLSEYIAMISDMAKQTDLKTACVVGPRPEAYLHELLVKTKNLDYLGPDPYWIYPGSQKNTSWVAEMTKAYRKICDEGNKLLWVVIQGHNIPSGREAEIYEAGRLAAENGADVLCGYFHWRGTENPEATWDTIFRMLIDFGKKNRGTE